MNPVNANDLHCLSKIKSDMMFVMWQLESDETYSKEDAARELNDIAAQLIDFEQHVSESYLASKK